MTRARDKANLTQKITTSEPTQLTDGMIWLDTDAVAVSQQSMRWTKTPSGGTTVLSGASDTSITLSYSVGQESVYANGVLLIRGSDYTASDGTSITLASASVAGDVFEVISIIPLTLVDTYTQAQADGKFVNNTLADAKGDLVVGTADNVISKIAVGSNGQSLVADSTTTSGLRWQDSFVAGKNKIINGDFGIWQRGTSKTVTADDYYAPDRFLSTYIGGGATVTWSQQTFTPGTAPVTGYEGTFFSRLSATSGSGTTVMGLSQKVEDVRTFANQTATFSFWAKADSARLATILIFQEFGSGGSATVIPLNTTQTLSTSWARYSFTVAMPSVSGKTIGAGSNVRCYVYYNTGAASGSPQLDTWGWQLEAGSVATPFTPAGGGLIGAELALCQRYFCKSYSVGVVPGGASNDGIIYSGGNAVTTTGYLGALVEYPVTMRANPTVTTYDTAYAQGKVARVTPGAADQFNLTPSGNLPSDKRITILVSGGNAHSGLGFHYTASAEL